MPPRENTLLSKSASAQAILGQKGYELTNHLGNVMAVVSDKRYEVDSNNMGIIWKSKPVLSAANDYYPFGMLMPDRYVQAAADTCIPITKFRKVDGVVSSTNLMLTYNPSDGSSPRFHK